MADKQVVTKPAGRALLLAVESAQLRKDIPEIKSGDTVRLQVKVVEGNRERLQPFEGVVMRLRGLAVRVDEGDVHTLFDPHEITLALRVDVGGQDVAPLAFQLFDHVKRRPLNAVEHVRAV